MAGKEKAPLQAPSRSARNGTALRGFAAGLAAVIVLAAAHAAVSAFLAAFHPAATFFRAAFLTALLAFLFPLRHFGFSFSDCPRISDGCTRSSTFRAEPKPR
jgi:drug/metabolite transporter (DMT)-like permease